MTDEAGQHYRHDQQRDGGDDEGFGAGLYLIFRLAERRHPEIAKAHIPGHADGKSGERGRKNHDGIHACKVHWIPPPI